MRDGRGPAVGLVGFGMIVEETYLPAFERAAAARLVAAATRTGSRVARYLADPARRLPPFANLAGPDAAADLARADVDAVCVATPDDRHFAPALAALEVGKHVLIEKPSVLSLADLDRLVAAADRAGVLAKVVYHKLLDPDHKALRTLVSDGVLKHVNNGYCSLLEPKSVAAGQFAEWVTGRNPATYVAVHYLKLIDFTFGPDWELARVTATGQRGIVGPADGPTWDSVQTQVVYRHPGGREAAFDIHTSWVTPDDFPGYVEQEVQFRFDNGVWAASQRKRGVELAVEGRTPHTLKNTPNHHYNANLLEPWGDRGRRGYGVEAVTRFFEEVTAVEAGGPPGERDARLARVRGLAYNDLSADRNVVAAVQAVEAILSRAAGGRPGCVAVVNGPAGGLALLEPGSADVTVLYEGRV